MIVMRTINTAIDIDAPQSAVWDVLVDLSSYIEWNPHITAAEGELQKGKPLDIRVNRKGTKARDLTVTITHIEPERRLEWVGTIGAKWLFEGRHVFELEPISSERTRFHNREEVSGLVRSLIMTDNPERDYKAMNEALKTRIENTSDKGTNI